MDNDYEYNLTRTYKAKKPDYQTPKPKRLSKHKIEILNNPFPIQVDCGTIIINDRGDIIVKYNDNTSGYYIDAPETIKLISD